MKKYGDEKNIFWVNLRQEPVIYVNGKPFTAREADKLNYHVEISNPEDITKYEEAFAKEVKERGDDFKFFQDQYGEHPEERAVKNEEVTEKLADVNTLTSIFGGLKEKNGKVSGVQRISTVEDRFYQVFEREKMLIKSIFCQNGSKGNYIQIY